MFPLTGSFSKSQKNLRDSTFFDAVEGFSHVQDGRDSKRDRKAHDAPQRFPRKGKTTFMFKVKVSQDM